MLAPEDKQKLLNSMKQLQQEVKLLQQSLSEVYTAKEVAFKKKQLFSEQIRQRFHAAKESKKTRDQLTKQVKDSKQKRSSLHGSIQEKAKELHTLQDKSKGLQQDTAFNPYRIKQQIEILENKIETEVMSFAKEQELMKKIKELQKMYQESKGVSEIASKMRETRKQIHSLRQEAETIHHTVQATAESSQQQHEALLHSSQELQDLAAQEQAAFTEGLELKKKFAEAQQQLHEKLTALREIQGKLNLHFSDAKAEHQSRKKQTLTKLKEQVEEKLKTGKKLTTEDLLVLQSED